MVFRPIDRVHVQRTNQFLSAFASSPPQIQPGQQKQEEDLQFLEVVAISLGGLIQRNRIQHQLEVERAEQQMLIAKLETAESLLKQADKVIKIDPSSVANSAARNTEADDK